MEKTGTRKVLSGVQCWSHSLVWTKARGGTDRMLETPPILATHSDNASGWGGSRMPRAIPNNVRTERTESLQPAPRSCRFEGYRLENRFSQGRLELVPSPGSRPGTGRRPMGPGLGRPR